MEDLLKKLQEEVGLSKEQSVEAVKIVKEFMDKEGIEIDWNKFFKEKYENLRGNSKTLFDTLSDKAQKYSTKLEDKAEDLTIQAKRAVRDLSQKASDFLDDNKKK